MSQRALCSDGFRFALLAAIAGALGCPEEGEGARTEESEPELAIGFEKCVPDGDLGYPGSGVVQCSEHFLHREQALECRPDLLRPGADGYPASRAEADLNSNCFADEDCRRNGTEAYCVARGNQLSCVKGCRQDSDCDGTQLCLCSAEAAGKCVAADCRTDADCPEGALCTGPADLSGYLPVHFSCQQATDECAADSQCGGSSHCHFEPVSGHKACRGPGGVPGRPFLVQGQARMAPVEARATWLGALHPSAERHDGDVSLSDADRARVVEHWSRAAQLEHASIAAFARFSLQLLSLGAPSQLVHAASAAMADEARHAEAAFAVASHFHRAALGPGPLSLQNLDLNQSLRSVVVEAILEGCVGETLAALQAAEALAGAEHPRVREALAEVAQDEARHAELAWSFVAWALGHYGDGLLETIDATFEHAEAAGRAGAGAPLASGLPGWGLPHGADLERVRRDAWQSVIRPCREALRTTPRARDAERGIRQHAGAHR